MKAYLCVAFFQNVLVASNENCCSFFFFFLFSFITPSFRAQQIRYSFLVFYLFISFFFIFILFRNENVSRRKIKEERQNVWLFFFFPLSLSLSVSLSLSLSFFLSLSLTPSFEGIFFSFLFNVDGINTFWKNALYIFTSAKNTYYMYTYIHIFNYPTYSTYN